MIKYNKYYRKFRVLLRGISSSFIFKILYRRGFDISESLLILGAPRSGSTWLAEIVSSLPGYSQVFEPLYYVYVKEAKVAGVKKNMFLKPDQEWQEGGQFFEKVLTGKLMNPWLASQIPFRKVINTRSLVVKCVRANLLMGWICENLPVKPPALVIRHPCAMVSSLLHKGWTPSKTVLLSNPYFDNYPDIREQCMLKLKEPEEFNALSWCLHYHSPLSLPKPYPYILLCYEKLVRDGKNELGLLFDAWDITMTEDITRQLNVASDTSTTLSQITRGSDPLSGWKNKLTKLQVENILGVLEIFGMDFYTEALEPDYKKLKDFSV